MEVHAQQPETRDLRDQLTGEGAGFEVLGDDRQRALAHEGAHGVADEALVVAEQVVDGEEIGGDQCVGAGRSLGDGHALKRTRCEWRGPWRRLNSPV